jgi:peptidoglycan/LPS O-acetylase OafA/YrhL
MKSGLFGSVTAAFHFPHGKTSAPIMVNGRERYERQRLSYSVHMDAIRGLAAFVVFAGHARMLFFGNHAPKAIPMEAASTPNVATPSIMGLGHHAVIVFFVLSGFLVGSSAWKAITSNQWSWRRYLLQRATRLWLVLLPALIIGGCLDHIGLKLLSHDRSIYIGPAGQGIVDQHLTNALTARVLAGNALFLQMVRVPTYGTNAALSTLTNEFWYYMLFPMVILLCVGIRPLWVRAVYAVLTLGIFAFVGANIAALFTIWLFGFVVSIVPLSIQPGYQRAVTIACLIQFVAVNLTIRVHALAPLLADGVLGISFSLFLYSIMHLRDPMRTSRYQAIATSFSNFSYTLYLFHLPFVTLLTALAITPWHPWPVDMSHIAAATLLVMITYGYAWLMYYCFERNTERVRAVLSKSRSGFVPKTQALQQI